MYDRYLAINDIEILNAERVSAHLKALAPQVDVTCMTAGINTALEQPAYTVPSAGAPWYRAGTAGERFYGLFPGAVEGAEDSTRTIPVTELAGDGAVHTMPRYGSGEIRVTATAIAADEEAMNEGLAWLRDVLAGEGCGDDAGFGCTGRDVRMFTAHPSTPAEAAAFARNFYSAEVIEGPLVTGKRRSASGVLFWAVEFTLSTGMPWAFTTPAPAGALAMDAASNYQDPEGQNCSEASNAYNDFITDPFFTAIAKPPRPAVILPPNLLDVTSWRRRTLALPAASTARWGRVVPVVNIVTGDTAVQQVRLRFYRGADLTGCDYDGEFLVSYVPANSTLTLDGIRRHVTVGLPDGRTVPGGHLLFGSAGKPFAWPSMGCQNPYTMTADLMPGQSGVTVLLDTAVRE